jgi:hypothetical protein
MASQLGAAWRRHGDSTSNAVFGHVRRSMTTPHMAPRMVATSVFMELRRTASNE